MENNQFLKVKNSLLELEKDFIKSKDRELKDREVKIKKEMEELLLKPFIVFIYDTDKLEQEGRKKIRPIKNTYDQLINYIPDPIRKSVGDVKEKIVGLYKQS